MSNPFNDRLDWSLKGKYVEVATDEFIYKGWVEALHHQRGSVVMHDCKRRVHPKYALNDSDPRPLDWSRCGAVFVRNPTEIAVLKTEQSKTIRYIDPRVTVPYRDHELDFEPVDKHMRMAYRNKYTGSFPVVRDLESDHPEYGTNDRYQILNGHKRIEAAKRVGLMMHPMEVIRCTDEEAEQLFEVAHRDQIRSDDDE